MAGVSVGDRLKNLNEKVRAACVASGRDPSSVRILAVSKLQGLSSIREAYAAGQRAFAENYVQEALGKISEVPAEWHFIGRIQSNKVKDLVGKFKVIHSIDRESVAAALNKMSVTVRQDIFLQFNVADEASKGGAGLKELQALVKFVIESCPNLRVLGLMVMPPLDEHSRTYFRQAREMQATIKAALTSEQLSAHPFDQLSMGTTADYVDAIAEGATWIRIGTEIFGPREEKQ